VFLGGMSSVEARERIASHPLLRGADESVHTVRIDTTRAERVARTRMLKKKVQRRILVHLFVFLISFIFTSGVALLGVLLWVRPDTPLSLVVTGLFSGGVFVACFASLRMFVLHHFLNEYPNREEDPGTFHHVSKSIAYGFVALVLAVVLVGLFINIASAGIV